MSEYNNSLFVVETPLQYINALEAKVEFDCGTSTLLLLYFDEKLIRKVLELVDESEWERILRYKIPFIESHIDFGARRPDSLKEKVIELRQTLERLLCVSGLSWKIWTLPNIDRVFVGNLLAEHKNYNFHAVNSAKAREVILLDDGLDTFLTNLERATPETAQRVKPNSLRSRIRQNFTQWNDSFIERITFFTAYPIKANEPDRIVRNGYKKIREGLANADSNDSILFLGQTFSEDDYCDVETHINLIEDATRILGRDRLRYVPHPRQADEVLKAVTEKLGLETLNPGMPIEMYLASAPTLPKAIASFCSTALPNCALIFGDRVKVVCFEFQTSKLRKQKEKIEFLYAELKSNFPDKIEFLNEDSDEFKALGPSTECGTYMLHE